MKLHLLLLLLISLSAAVFAQSPPQIEQNGNQIVEITNLMGKVAGFKCIEPSLYKGIVVKKWFEKDDLTISGFTLNAAKDNKISINLNNEQVKLLGRYSVDTMAALIKNGKRLQVWAYQCSGESGTLIYANRIKPL